MDSHQLEICAQSVTDVAAAARGGAHRIELCCALDCGGLTPSAALIDRARAATRLPLFVLLRPRPGGFTYDEFEWDVVIDDAARAMDAGVDGIVAGALTRVGELDGPRLERLKRRIGSLPLTLHRAFDHVRDPARALDHACALGITRVLTSGRALRAIDGVVELARFVALAAGRVEILSGGGVRADHVAELIARSGVREVHSSARGRRELAMHPASPGLDLAEYGRADTGVDEASVRALRTAVDALRR
ncbi:MAG: copper homeostasis protein CutC [Planctomycetes bacterium]|nr:copper homeostasis protein CutC [Planctomycetota bacterium]MCC7172829.1 copper homeostasis protein CutC [Planctomycetota bacterium]